MVLEGEYIEKSTVKSRVPQGRVLRLGYTVQHCAQYCAQHPPLDVATRSQHFVQHYAQYLISGYQALMQHRFSLKL